jgi:hypothetical protein
MHFVSDPRQKENTTSLTPEQAVQLVQNITPYTYNINNAMASAGLMATDVPPAYTRTTGDGMQTVDYNAMFTHLWAAVQHLIAEQGELRAMLRNGQPEVAISNTMSADAPPPQPSVTTIADSDPGTVTADNTAHVVTTGELEEELRSLIHSQEAPVGVQPRGPPFADRLLSWCMRALHVTFHVDTMQFTEWGAPVMKVALASLLEYEKERLPVELIGWIRDRVIPAVFVDSPMSPLHQEIAHIIVQCLLRPATIVGGSTKSIKRHTTIGSGADESHAPIKRHRKR